MSEPGDADAGPAAARYLLRDERLVDEVHWHPAWLLRTVLETLAALLVLGYVAAGLPAGSDAGAVVGALGVAALGRLAWKYGEWRTERLIITDRRLLLVTGILTRRVAVMPLRKVTDLTFVQPPFGRLFNEIGWGTFVFESAGQDQALHRVRFLPRPDDLYQRLTDEIFGDGGIYGRRPRTPGSAED